jgi:GNAT superfamily N-acetyltransferase
MQIKIREWTRNDLLFIQNRWLRFCRDSARWDMTIETTADSSLTEWLQIFFDNTDSLGLIADTNDRVPVGFLVGRLGTWPAVPPIIKPRRLGIIDAVYVDVEARRHGVATQLIQASIATMRGRGALAVETVYEATSEEAVLTWRSCGFEPWLERGVLRIQ